MKPALVEAGGIESIAAARDIRRVRPVLRPVDKIREVFSTLYIIYASVKDESLDLLR